MNSPICTLDGCFRAVYAKSLCNGHYSRLKRIGDVQADKPLKALNGTKICGVSWCENAVYVKGVCSMHYTRIRKGVNVDAEPKSKNSGLCNVENCTKTAQAKGLCLNHRRQWRLHRQPRPSDWGKWDGIFCQVEGCDREAVRKTPYPICNGHKNRLRKTGDVQADKPLQSRRKKTDPIKPTYDGYIRFHINGRNVAEHRLIMEKILGRKLLPGENVHHVNGVRHDNRPQNLELWVSKQPSGQRIPDLLRWAREIIEQYSELDEQQQLRLNV